VTSPDASTSPGTLERRRADPRLPAYLIAGFGALITAIATGRHELAALGAPFLALAAIGLADRRPPNVRTSIALDAERMIEGDEVGGAAHIDWDGVAVVDVMLSGLHGVTAVEPAPVVGWSLAAGRGPITLPFTLVARSWGIHDVGTLWVRVRRRGGMLVWERKLSPGPTIRVLPTPLRLDRLLRPAEPRAVAGMHLSRFREVGRAVGQPVLLQLVARQQQLDARARGDGLEPLEPLADPLAPAVRDHGRAADGLTRRLRR
jgi:uncharacterized protein (DUF58 family)